MKYYIDTEFDGFGGDLLSLGIASKADSLYLRVPKPATLTPWVAENVWPIIDAVPFHVNPMPLDEWPNVIAGFLGGDDAPHIVADWPDDIRYFCQPLITGPGEMVNIPRISFEVVRVDAYPSALTQAIQHNAWWDAQALKHLLS